MKMLFVKNSKTKNCKASVNNKRFVFVIWVQLFVGSLFSPLVAKEPHNSSLIFKSEAIPVLKENIDNNTEMYEADEVFVAALSMVLAYFKTCYNKY